MKSFFVLLISIMKEVHFFRGLSMQHDHSRPDFNASLVSLPLD